jgi:hypothetical protein
MLSTQLVSVIAILVFKVIDCGHSIIKVHLLIVVLRLFGLRWCRLLLLWD